MKVSRSCPAWVMVASASAVDFIGKEYQFETILAMKFTTQHDVYS